MPWRTYRQGPFGVGSWRWMFQHQDVAEAIRSVRQQDPKRSMLVFFQFSDVLKVLESRVAKCYKKNYTVYICIYKYWETCAPWAFSCFMHGVICKQLWCNSSGSDAFWAISCGMLKLTTCSRLRIDILGKSSLIVAVVFVATFGLIPSHRFATLV